MIFSRKEDSVAGIKKNTYDTLKSPLQVSLGKAHAVALTGFGQVYTFGINNKGQCGREFGYTKESKCFLKMSVRDAVYVVGDSA